MDILFHSRRFKVPKNKYWLKLRNYDIAISMMSHCSIKSVAICNKHCQSSKRIIVNFQLTFNCSKYLTLH